MPFALLAAAFSFLPDLLHVVMRTERDRTVELLLLRQQLRVYQR